jgi:CHAD domain-containing protein
LHHVLNRHQPSSGFHLEPTERITDGISRAVREQLQAAADVLSSADDVDEAIHEARRGLKKARSVLKLGHTAFGSLYRDEGARLRDLGRKLSSVRDAVALVEAVAHLEEDEGDENAKAAAQRTMCILVHKRNAITRHFLSSGQKDRVAEALNRVVGQSAAWPVEQIDFSALRTGVKRTVKRGRRARKKARVDPRSENFHEWRKRAKDFRYQLRFLRKLSPDGFEKYSESAKKLEQKLGEEHNLAVLQNALKDLALPDLDAAALMSAIQKRQVKLRKEALRLGDFLYQESPKLWGRQLAKHWRGAALN